MITFKDNTLYLKGSWTLPSVDVIKKAMDALSLHDLPHFFIIDGSQVKDLDTNGCVAILSLLKKTKTAGKTGELSHFSQTQQTLFSFIQKRLKEEVAVKNPSKPLSQLQQLGRYGLELFKDVIGFLNFTGEASLILGKNLLKPWQIRWPAFWSNIQTAGVNALVIVGLLNFLVGVVITYQGGTLLRTFGVNIFAVDLITISTLRILAPMLTAIIIAGRTGSAFAAQIGTMKVNEEVDALRTIGINPIDQLVIPKLLAMLIAMPFLTLFADILGIFGGMVLSYFLLDINFTVFLERIPEVVTINSFLVGIAQTPFFAIIITFVGCYQGFQVSGGADSVGRQTTVAVVQSIFLVIIFEAIFSISTRSIGL